MPPIRKPSSPLPGETAPTSSATLPSLQAPPPTPAPRRMEGTLFPPIEPYAQDRLDVGDGHQLYVEQCGNPHGMPLIVLHGGPGSGCSPRHRQLIDPEQFLIVLFDQRGCGRSTPRGELAANTTAYLVADIERLRQHLGIDRWLVFGGSWGSSLALAYCAQHPVACLGAILRGIFLTGHADIDWFFRGAGSLRPEAWARLVAPLSDVQRANIAEHYLNTVRAPDRHAAITAVERWMQWEAALSSPGRGAPELPKLEGDAIEAALDKYRLQAHYLAHECFIGEDAALTFARAMGGIPTAILHGRLDLVCRPENALKLSRALPGSQLRFVHDAGHSPFDARMSEALIGAATHFHRYGSFSA
ncbi:MAG: prolyl aminopeptidase [Azoarcus sp.]|nr:prolyl aminopeptidase [Azoarcus sp.]